MMINLALVFILVAFSAEDSKLVQAVGNGTAAQVKTLAQNQTELNWKDSGGFDALFYAVSLNEIEKVEVLLAAGASTKNFYTSKKESILFEAARLNAQLIMTALLKKDPSLLKIKNTENESPLFEAVRTDQSKMVQYLLNKGLSLKEKNKSGKVPADYVDPKNKKMVALFKKLTK